jgi:hypothetical protein
MHRSRSCCRIDFERASDFMANGAEICSLRTSKVCSVPTQRLRYRSEPSSLPSGAWRWRLAVSRNSMIRAIIPPAADR